MEIIRLDHAKHWPDLPPLSPEQMKQAHALARAAFTADDLQKFTELGEGEPMESVIQELEKKQWLFQYNNQRLF